MAKLRVISADSHMMEPADLWQQRLDNKFRDPGAESGRKPEEAGLHLCGGRH